MFPSVLLLLDVAAVTAAAASASTTAPASWSVLSTVLVALFTCAVATACFLWHYRARFVPGVPRPRAVPIFGQTNQILSNLHRHHELMQEFANEVGDGKCFSIGLFHIGRPRRFVTLGANEALTKHVLKDKFDNYIKGPIFYDIFQVLLGEGIFNVDSDQWRRHRKIASWMFSLRHLQEDMLKVFVRNGDSVQTRLTSAAESGEVFDIQDIFFRYTLDSFSEIAFGVNPGCLSHMGTPIPFATAFDTVQRLVNDRFHNPLWALLNFFQIGNEKIITEQSKILNDFAYDVIKHRRQQTETVDGYEQLKANSDLLTRFLVEAQERNRGKYEEEKSQQETQTESTAAASPNQHTRQMTEALTDEELRDVVLNFIIAGRDTTACLLAWAVYELTRNPAWEARLLAAIREKYSATGSYKECGDLAIVKNFLHETLRLHPSVPADMKCAIKDDILPDGTKVYAGDNVGYSPYMFGRSKRLWGEDAEQFKPERWEKESPSEFKFISFNAGPRLCLGKRVAILEAGLLFSMLVNKFTVELAGHSKQHVTYMFTVTMPVKDGLMVKVKARS